MADVLTLANIRFVNLIRQPTNRPIDRVLQLVTALTNCHCFVVVGAAFAVAVVAAQSLGLVKIPNHSQLWPESDLGGHKSSHSMKPVAESQAIIGNR